MGWIFFKQMLVGLCNSIWTFTPQATTARRQSPAMAPRFHRRCDCARRSPGGSAASSGAGCAAAWEPTSTSSSRRRQGEVEEMRRPVWTASNWSPPHSALVTACHPPRYHPVPRRLAAKASPTWSRGRRWEEGGRSSLLPPPPPLRLTIKSPAGRQVCSIFIKSYSNLLYTYHPKINSRWILMCNKLWETHFIDL